jgi:hypothetical protein
MVYDADVEAFTLICTLSFSWVEFVALTIIPCSAVYSSQIPGILSIASAEEASNVKSSV